MTDATDSSFEIEFFEGVLRHNPSDADAIEILGGLYSDLGQVDDSLRMDQKLVDLQPRNAMAHYNLACSLALKDCNEDALRVLRHAVNLGYRDAKWLRDDPDFLKLRQHPTFQEIVVELEKLPQDSDPA